ncbi:MAG TPA: hypothetical protein ENK60_06955 [Anaerolineae bacterium]|nr:hypothetical protein [Anaerolineae bacterium]
MKSAIFYTDAYHQIENRVKDFINGHPAFLSSRSMDSPRAVGDAIESIIRDEFDQILGDLSQEYSAQFARRAMADIAFTDHDGLYYIVDVKTHRTDTRFNMPNLTSVQRLARFYEDDSNYFVILLIEYHIDTRPVVTNVIFVPIEFLGWDCLTIGALGWGQIQIANAKHITINAGYSRKKWMLELCDVVLAFYPREIAKIQERISYFEKVREFWQSKEKD